MGSAVCRQDVVPSVRHCLRLAAFPENAGDEVGALHAVPG